MATGQNLLPKWVVLYAKSAIESFKKNQNRIEYSTFFIGALYAFGVMVVSSLLYYYNQGPFTVFSHWFSNLGVGPTGWSFNYGLQGTAILYLAMVVVYFWRFIRSEKITRWLAIIATPFGLIAVIGIFILTNYNIETGTELHGIGAYMFFIATPFFTSFISVALKFEGSSSKAQWIISIWLVVISISMAPLMIIMSGQSNLPTESVLASMDPRYGLVRLIEWISVVSFYLWIFMTGFRHKVYLENKDENLK
jgi:hypothetical protein